MKKHLFLLLLLLFCSFSFAEEYRAWTGSNGKKIEAEFISFDQETEIVHIRLKNGKGQRVKLSLFSEEDKLFVRYHRKPSDKSMEKRRENAETVGFDKESFYSLLRQEAESAFQKIDKSSLKPTDYANLGIVQALSGDFEESTGSFASAIKWNEEQFSDMQSFYSMRIAYAAIVANQLDCAEKCLNVLEEINHPWFVEVSAPLAVAHAKNGNKQKAEIILKNAAAFVKSRESMQKNRGMYLRPIAAAWANIGNDDNAIAIASQSPTLETLTVILIAKACIETGKEEKVNDYLSIAEDTSYPDAYKTIVAKAWLDAGNIGETYSIANRIQDLAYKSYLLREIGCKCLVDKNEEKARKIFGDSLKIKTQNWTLIYERFVLETILTLTGLIDDTSDMEIKTEKLVRQISNRSEMYKHLFNIALYRKILGNERLFENILMELEKVDFTNENDYESLCGMWLAVASGLDLIGDNERAASNMNKAQKIILRISDPKKRETLSKSFEGTPNSTIHWSRTPMPLYDNRIVGHLSMLRLTANLLLQLNRPDKAQEFIKSIELPEAKLYLCRLFAEAVNVQSP